MKKNVKNCDSYKSIVSICILVCMLTAVAVSLVFAIGFNETMKSSGNKTSSAYEGTFAKETAADAATYDENSISILSAGAVADFFESSKTGFIYVSSDDCTDCSIFATRLADAIKGTEAAAVYHLNLSTGDNATEAENYAKALTGENSAYPILVYVNEGKVYDRLDDTNSEALVASFLAKYK